MMLTWAIYEVSSNKQILNKALQEANELLGKSHKIGDQLPLYKEIKKSFHYSENILKEALRKWSVVPVLTRFLYFFFFFPSTFSLFCLLSSRKNSNQNKKKKGFLQLINNLEIISFQKIVRF